MYFSSNIIKTTRRMRVDVGLVDMMRSVSWVDLKAGDVTLAQEINGK
jgi:hypothetical protein